MYYLKTGFVNMLADGTEQILTTADLFILLRKRIWSSSHVIQFITNGWIFSSSTCYEADSKRPCNVETSGTPKTATKIAATRSKGIKLPQVVSHCLTIPDCPKLDGLRKTTEPLSAQRTEWLQGRPDYVRKSWCNQFSLFCERSVILINYLYYGNGKRKGEKEKAIKKKCVAKIKVTVLLQWSLVNVNL